MVMEGLMCLTQFSVKEQYSPWRAESAHINVIKTIPYKHYKYHPLITSAMKERAIPEAPSNSSGSHSIDQNSMWP